MIDQYKKGVTYTDARVRLTTEVIFAATGFEAED